jgi:hypothetical protein
MPRTKTGLMDVAAVAELVERGERLLLAGDEALLRELPRGDWIGGTIPYFVDAEGGRCTATEVFVDVLPREFEDVAVVCYTAEELSRIAVDAPENGVSFVILPATSRVHLDYAQRAPDYPQMYLKPVVGWVAGVHLNDLGKVTPKVFDGRTGTAHEDAAVVLHAALAPGCAAAIEIVNIFEQSDSASITFPRSGFHADRAVVDGVEVAFADLLTKNGIDTQLPLVADCFGAHVNVSFQAVKGAEGVDFYAPVFEGVSYRLARPVEDYARRFRDAIPERADGSVFRCNCILNYLYGKLEGRRAGSFTGPMTFGEVAYQLLNQTMVFVRLLRVGE